MSALAKIFEYGGHQVRVGGEPDEPLFVAADVCSVLEIKYHRDAIAKLDEDERGSLVIDTLGGSQSVSGVTESGLYALIFKSRKASAKKFRKWVTAEVLPAIRKTGSYGAKSQNEEMEELINNPQLLIGMAERVQELQEKATKQTALIEDMRPIEAFGRKMLIDTELSTETEIARQLGTSARELNRFLESEGCIMREGEGQPWFPTLAYENADYFRVIMTVKQETDCITGHSTARNYFQLKVTPKGRAFIANLWRNRQME